MSQEITVTNNKLLIVDGACSLTADRVGNQIYITIVSDVDDNIFSLDADSAHILSIFLKHT